MRRSALLGLLVLLACRKAPEPPQVRTPAPKPAPEIARAVRQARPVLFVGLDGADWELLDGYMAAGVMPNLAALAREGRTGVLTTLHPPLSPLVWTTMMTGTSPLEHRILDFTRRHPQTGTLEPITSGERRVPAVWNMATDGGKSVAVFGLWATWPAEPVRGLMVADRFSSFTSHDREPPPGVVYPPEQETWAREVLNQAEESVGYEAIHEILPWLSEEEYERRIAAPDPYAQPVSALRRILVETRAYHQLAMSWLSRQRPDLAVVYFQGTDTVGHVFAAFAPPRQESVPPEDFERFSAVPERYYAEVDRLLGDYRKLAAAAGAVLVIASDHGFLWREGRPTRLSSAAAATAGRWHRDEGIYLLWGPGIEPRANRGEGKVDQVCSTLLALLGLPPGKGLAGPPLAGVEPSHSPLADYATRYKPYQPATGMEIDEAANQEEIARLRSLGYLGTKEGKGPAVATGSTRTAGSYNNEGLLRRGRGEAKAAAAAFEQALAVEPANASALWNLSDLLHHQRQELDRSDDLLIRALESGLPEGVDYTVGRTVAYGRSGDAKRSLRLLDQALTAKPEEPRLRLLRGRYRLQRHQCEKALGDFESAARSEPDNALAHNSVGLARLCIGDGEGAARAFRRSLKVDPDQPEIRRALGQIGESSAP
jgi:tetratricopeptide (TPR) repeat protein